jgi:hypothetical protein
MKVVCAWCEKRGQAGYLGERAPLDNPGITHGLCLRHAGQLLESLPSRSFPDARVLIVVPENGTTLYEHLQRRFAGVRYVQVIRERRAGDRRREPCFVTDDLRHQTRRIREGRVSPLGYVVVRFKPIEARRTS